jgi:hypothetical protein
MDDLISRHAAIDALMEIIDRPKHADFLYTDEICKTLNELPSAQPEIIRCKDCKWMQGSECVRFAEVRPFPDDFCSKAERRTNGV